MQGKVIRVTPLCWGSSILPMCGTHGMWATSGPSCSAKETPVWSSPASSRSAHSPLRAYPEGCVGSFSPGPENAFFPMLRCCCIGSVLLMQLFLWNWAFPLPRQRLWFISNLHPEVPSSSFPPETFCLRYGFSCCGDRTPCSCLMPGRARRGPRRERHTSAQPWDGGGESGSQLCSVTSDKNIPPSFCSPSLCSFWGLASQLTPAHDLLSILLASGRGILLLPCPLWPLHILLCCPSSSLSLASAISLLLPGLYCHLPFEPGTAPSHLLPALLHLGSLGMSRAKGACTGASSLGGLQAPCCHGEGWAGLELPLLWVPLPSLYEMKLCAKAELRVGISS